MLDIFFQILFVLQENDLFLSSKITLQKHQHKNSPLPYTHTTQIKIQLDKGSIDEPRGKGTHIFYETIKLVWL